MTNLQAFKVQMLDEENKLLDDDGYASFMEMYGFTSSETYSVSSFSDMMLMKADLLESITANPTKLASYSAGNYSEQFTKDLLLQLAKTLRARFKVVK